MGVLSKLLFMRAVVVRLSLMTLLTLPVSACRFGTPTPPHDQMGYIAGRLGGGTGAGGTVNAVAAGGGRFFVAEGFVVRVFELEDPSKPRLVGEVWLQPSGSVGERVTHLFTGSDQDLYAITSSDDVHQSRLHLLSVRGPRSPRVRALSFLPLQVAPDARVLLKDGFLYTAADKSGEARSLVVIDVKDPLAPHIVSHREVADGYLHGPIELADVLMLVNTLPSGSQELSTFSMEPQLEPRDRWIHQGPTIVNIGPSTGPATAIVQKSSGQGEYSLMRLDSLVAGRGHGEAAPVDGLALRHLYNPPIACFEDLFANEGSPGGFQSLLCPEEGEATGSPPLPSERQGADSDGNLLIVSSIYDRPQWRTTLGLQVIKQDPTGASEAGAVLLTSLDGRGATPLIQQGFAYLAMRGCRLATLDLQDWRKPRLVDELRCGGPVRWLQADPRTSGQVLTDGSIVDITDPEQPRRIGWWPARAVPDGDRLYRLQQDSMSVSRWSPSGPGSELGRFPTGGAPVALDVYGGFAYIAHTVEGYLSNDEDRSGVVQASLEWIQIIDATQTSAMREVGRIAGIGSKMPELQWGRPSRIRKGDACWGGGHGTYGKRRVGIVKVGAAGLFLGIGPSLRRYDISDPSKPRLVAEVDLDGAVVDMVLEDDWLAVSHMESDSRNRASSAITVVDISDTESLDVIDELAVSDDSCGPLLAAEGRRLAAASGLIYYLYEVAKPVKSLMEWRMYTGDTDGFADMALIGDVLVLAGGDQGLITMRIPENATPSARPFRDLERPPP